MTPQPTEAQRRYLERMESGPVVGNHRDPHMLACILAGWAEPKPMSGWVQEIYRLTPSGRAVLDAPAEDERKEQ